MPIFWNNVKLSLSDDKKVCRVFHWVFELMSINSDIHYYQVVVFFDRYLYQL